MKKVNAAHSIYKETCTKISNLITLNYKFDIIEIKINLKLYV